MKLIYENKQWKFIEETETVAKNATTETPTPVLTPAQKAAATRAANAANKAGN